MSFKKTIDILSKDKIIGEGRFKIRSGRDLQRNPMILDHTVGIGMFPLIIIHFDEPVKRVWIFPASRSVLVPGLGLGLKSGPHFLRGEVP